MNFKMKTAAAAILAASLVASYGFADDAKPVVKKPVTTKKTATKKVAAPTVEEQIEKLRTELEGQISGLKSNLADKDAQLKQAQQSAAEAQAAAAKAQQAVDAQQQADTTNAAAVSTLENTVKDLKGNQASLAATVSDETASIKKAINNPSTLHYKGITMAPYGFINGETVYRSKATGGEMPTPFSSLQYEGADQYSMSEMYISGRQSRLGLTVEGKTAWGTMRAIVEGDFLGTGTTSNDNQSTSYIFRQRIALAEVENKGWTVSAGQGWSLVAENRKGITTAASNVALPNQIDPNYVTGLVWARSGGVRLTKSFKNASFAVSAENPQLLYTAALAGNTPYAVVGSAGVNGGLLNQAVSACTATTQLYNYQSQVDGTSQTAIPQYKTVTACANLANLSFNKAPDMVVKAAFDPMYGNMSLGHYEIFGVGRFFHETVYPGETTNAQLFGGQVDIETNTAPVASLSTAGAVSNSVVFGGFGGSARVPVMGGKFILGAKGLYGPGVGHFGDSTLSDATTNGWGGLAPIHNLSGLLTVEANPTPRLNLYAYYGGDYAGREDYALAPGAADTTYSISSTPVFCTTPGTASTCSTTPANTASGKWGAHYTANTTPVALGYGSRFTNNSTCGTTSAPGINTGASTGFAAGGGCGAHTRNVQEVTGGYWYDLYKGDHGRLRQGIQYGYTVREGWSGSSTGTGLLYGAKGIDNMVFTSFRYYLP